MRFVVTVGYYAIPAEDLKSDFNRRFTSTGARGLLGQCLPALPRQNPIAR
jgi:hypothetical protein